MTKNDIDSPLYYLDDDDTPLYRIEDENPVTSDASIMNYADSYESENSDETEDDDITDAEDMSDEDMVDDDENASGVSLKSKSLSPLRVMVKAMMTPVEGLKALKRARFKNDCVAKKCFMPLMLFATLSECSDIFYEGNVSGAECAINCISTLLAFFFGYFIVMLIGGIILPQKARDFLRKDIGKQFVMMAESTIALFWAVIQLMPMLDPILVFLPLWTIYIIFKGVRVFRIPEEIRNSTTGLLCMLIIGAPLFCYWLITEYLF